uniref:Squamous cell carcinoma antigen recognized by T-cells 3 n=1 Tax=Romanomermis culicivorax TaxID=13658 RepID=A0A915K7V6_ROMCU
MSDFDSDEQIDELMPTEVDLDALEREVNLNSSNYNAHLELINACRSCGELERLRSARIRMSSVYPLSPKLWRDWIDDEKQFTINQSDRVTFMRSLFDRAVVDYTSFDVWLDYIQWAVGCGDHSLTRQICERAVSAVGLHVGRGCLIWDAFRIFEKAVLDMQICQEELNSSDSRNSAAGEAEYEEFCANAKESVDTALLNNYKNALSTLEKLRAFEQALLDTEVDDSTTENNSKMENLLAYQNYIDFEVKNGDSPARIKCLFERAITDHCLDSDLWVKYLDWLNRKLRVKSQISLTCYRATRNCPWSTKIWQNYLLSFERWSFDIFRHPQGNSIDIIEETRNNIGNEKILDEIFLRALNEGGYTTATECCQLWLSRIYQIRRNIEISQNRVYEPLRKAFEDGSAFLKEKFSELGWDSDCQFRLSWARAEGLFLKDLTEFRRIFDEIMAEGGNGKKAQAWLQYFGLEREFNPHPSSDNGRFARKILIKAVNSVSDYPESIFAQFLQFELEFGTLSDYDDALYRIEQQRARLKIRSQSKAQNKNELAKKRYQPKGGRSSPTKTKSKRKLEETETEK